MLSLGLAKELRNAGFPNIQDLQHRQGRQFLASDGRVSVYSLGELAPPENWFIPTLEELIEACGENFGSLDKQHDGWLASANFNQNCFAKTPAEVVARLWLALQKR